MAVTVALSFAPQAVMQAGRIREARRLRGAPSGAWPRCRGMALARARGRRSTGRSRWRRSMDTRGYGRRATVAAPGATGDPARHRPRAAGRRRRALRRARRRRAAGPRPAAARASAAVALAAGLFAGGTSGRAHPLPARPVARCPSGSSALSGLAALAGTIVAGPAPVAPRPWTRSSVPLAWPTVPAVRRGGRHPRGPGPRRCAAPALRRRSRRRRGRPRRPRRHRRPRRRSLDRAGIVRRRSRRDPLRPGDLHLSRRDAPDAAAAST